MTAATRLGIATLGFRGGSGPASGGTAPIIGEVISVATADQARSEIAAEPVVATAVLAAEDAAHAVVSAEPVGGASVAAAAARDVAAVIVGDR